MLIKWVLLSRKRIFFKFLKYLASGISSAVPASLVLSLKWELSRDVIQNKNKTILYLIESRDFMNRYQWNRGERGFFPHKGWNDERVVAGP